MWSTEAAGAGLVGRDLCEVLLCWFSSDWRSGPSLENHTGSCAFNWRSDFQSGALKEGMPVRFLLDNLFPPVRVALFWKPVCFGRC